MIYRNILLLLIFGNILSQSNIAIDRSSISEFQKSWMILQNNGLFHSAKISNELSFEIKATEQHAKFKQNLQFDNRSIDGFRLRTMHAVIEIPIYIQIGLSITLPTYTVYNYDTELTGYFIKAQLNQWIWSALPDLALHVSRSELNLASFFKNINTSASMIVSEEFYFMEAFASFSYANSQANLYSNNNETELDRVETFPTFGLNVKSTFFALSAESIIFKDYTNYALSISLKF